MNTQQKIILDVVIAILVMATIALIVLWPEGTIRFVNPIRPIDSPILPPVLPPVRPLFASVL